VQGESDLFESIGAAYPPRRLSSLLHSRQKQRNKHANDGDHNQQLNECKTVVLRVTPQSKRAIPHLFW
jgi:hypothetical protein